MALAQQQDDAESKSKREATQAARRAKNDADKAAAQLKKDREDWERQKELEEKRIEKQKEDLTKERQALNREKNRFPEVVTPSKGVKRGATSPAVEEPKDKRARGTTGTAADLVLPDAAAKLADEASAAAASATSSACGAPKLPASATRKTQRTSKKTPKAAAAEKEQQQQRILAELNKDLGPGVLDDGKDYEVSRIVAHAQHEGKWFFQVQWKDCPDLQW